MKYKCKKLKITFTESVLISIFFIIIILFVLTYPKGLGNAIFLKENSEDIIFPGIMQSKVVFDNKYADYVYKNNDEIESHLVDIKKGTEVTIKEFINKNKYADFTKKELELLNLKYPLYISDALYKSDNKTYWFKENELTIKYNDLLDFNKEFNITINYNEIKDYLNFYVNLDKEYKNESGYDYDKNKTTVAFSFDDGPNNQKTIQLINALEDYKMSATFFMVGYKLENDSSTVKYVASSHSEIGYHSLNHKYLTKQNSATIKSEFNYSDNILYSITGKHFLLTRPPYGSYNQSVVDALTTPIIRWNLDTNDWRYKDTEYIINYVLENIKDGAIILFHDSYDTSVEAACQLMKILYEKDIQVVNVTTLAKIKNISLSPHEVYYSF